MTNPLIQLGRSTLYGMLVLLMLLVSRSTAIAESDPPHQSPLSVNGIGQSDDNDFWDVRFTGPPGVDQIVTAIAVSDDGSIYVGGQFLYVNNVRANHIARYDPSSNTWAALGNGIDSCEYCFRAVHAIAIRGNTVYVGGEFSRIGDLNVGGIAKWDGAKWSALGERPFGGAVHALALKGQILYVGGEAGIEQWDETTWSYVGGNVSECASYCVEAIAVDGDNVYVAGDFRKASSRTVNYIARWDGVRWHSLGKGITSNEDLRTVTALAVNEGDVYIGGYFSSVDDVPTHRVAHWDGKAWHDLGAGVNNCYGCGLSVNALLLVGNELYVGGRFRQAGEIRANHLAVWNRRTQQWSTLGKGVRRDHYPPLVEAFAKVGDSIFVGGEFASAGNQSAANLAQWNRTSKTWLPIGETTNNSVNDYVHAIVPHGDDVYLGGEFWIAGGKRARKIVKWNHVTNEWSSLGKGIGGVCGKYCRPQVRAITTMDEQVFAGGVFTKAGGALANHVARWDGHSWSALGEGITGGDFPAVSALATDSRFVYVGGTFTRAGDIGAENIAMWDTRRQRWEPLGSGLNRYVSELVLAPNGDLYAAGGFTQAGSLNVNHIARWDGTRWHRLGKGLTNSPDHRGPVYINGLAMQGSDLYVIGTFDTAGDVTAHSIAKWDGQTWSAVGNTDIYTVNLFALTVSDAGTVYVGGVFHSINGVPTEYIARWDGNQWSSLGSGTNSSVFELASAGSDVYVSGPFVMAGEKSAYLLGLWHEVR